MEVEQANILSCDYQWEQRAANYVPKFLHSGSSQDQELQQGSDTAGYGREQSIDTAGHSLELGSFSSTILDQHR